MAENKTDNRIQVEKKLTEISRLSDEEVLNLLQTDTEGLNPLEASSRLEEYGKNIIEATPGLSFPLGSKAEASGYAETNLAHSCAGAQLTVFSIHRLAAVYPSASLVERSI